MRQRKQRSDFSKIVDTLATDDERRQEQLMILDTRASDQSHTIVLLFKKEIRN